MLAPLVLALPALLSSQDAALGPYGRVQRLVVEALAARERDPAALRRALAALGPEALDTLLIAAAGRSLSVSLGDGQSVQLPLDDELRGVLLDAAAAQPRAARDAALERLDPAWLGEGAREVVLDLLARCGEPQDLPRLERACALGEQPVAPALRASARAALERLARCEGELPWRRLWSELHGGLLVALLDVLESARPAQALDVLGACIGARPAADGLLLERVEGLVDPRAAPRPVLVQEVRRCLLRSDRGAQQFAVRILGALGDVEAVEDLAPLLISADAALAGEARATLRALVRDDLGPDPKDWLAWLALERAWLAERGPALAAALASGSDGEAVQALRELPRRRIDRGWRASTAALALRRESPDLLVLACSTLERIGTHAEREALDELAEHPDERVRLAAQSALRALAPRPTQS